jgi:uncharacterized repeat protein (TIGR01451 family)/fimbrial isopeptide formation D2 family protein
MTMALVLSVFSAANVGAHSVTIETPALTASRAEWFGLQGDSSGIGVIQRNASQQGEYIFNDAGKDQRLITTTQPVTRETDLDWFGVTADATNISFLAKIDQLNGITNNPSLELLITVDTNQQNGSGTTDLPLQPTTPYSTTKVANDAAWEFALRTTFPSGAPGSRAVNGTTRIHTNAVGNGTVCTSPANCSSQLASATVNQGNFAEVKVRWDQIGGLPTNGNYLRFTVSTLYNNHAVPADGYNSPVIDVLGTSPTLADLQDGTIDTSFDVHFDTTGEAYGPLLVTEFQPNPIGTDSPGPTNQSTESEWIEIYNPNSFASALPLSDYKVSNTPKRGSSSQGAYKFPNNSTIASGAVVIVARERSRFLAGHPGFVGTVYDLSGNSGASLNMTQYGAWAGGQLQLDNSPPTTGPNAGFLEEQVLLLDAKDGIVDMATYGNVTSTTVPVAYPGHTPIPVASVPEGVSYERCPAVRDTNNNSVDFITRNTPGEQTPGVACVGIPGIDLTVTKTGPSNPLVDDTTQARYVPYTITYSNVGINAEAGTVTVVDTLPAGLSFTNTPENASLAPTSVNGQVLTWNLTPAGMAAGTSGTIELTATVDVGVGVNVPLVNNVTISGPNEQEPAKINNAAAWTTTTIGPADLSVSSNLSGAVPPGAQFQFTITYRNTGQDDATDVTITDVLPAGVTILSVDSPGATWDGVTSGTVTWDVGTLPVNGSGTIVVTAQLASTVPVGTALPNSLNITTPVGDPTPGDNTESKTLTVGLRKLYIPIQLR